MKYLDAVQRPDGWGKIIYSTPLKPREVLNRLEIQGWYVVSSCCYGEAKGRGCENRNKRFDYDATLEMDGGKSCTVLH